MSQVEPSMVAMFEKCSRYTLRVKSWNTVMLSQVSFREGIPTRVMNQYPARQEPGPIAEGGAAHKWSFIYIYSHSLITWITSWAPSPAQSSVNVTHLNYPKPIHTLWFLGETVFQAVKLVPDAEDHCFRGWQILLLLCCWVVFFNRLSWILEYCTSWYTKKEQSCFWCTRKRSRNPVKKKQVWVLACGFYALLPRVLKVRNRKSFCS